MERVIYIPASSLEEAHRIAETADAEKAFGRDVTWFRLPRAFRDAVLDGQAADWWVVAAHAPNWRYTSQYSRVYRPPFRGDGSFARTRVLPASLFIEGMKEAVNLDAERAKRAAQVEGLGSTAAVAEVLQLTNPAFEWEQDQHQLTIEGAGMLIKSEDEEEILVPKEAQEWCLTALEEAGINPSDTRLVFDWAPEYERGERLVYRVVGGPIFGCYEGGPPFFATPHKKCVAKATAWNLDAALERGIATSTRILVVKATKWHTPVRSEKASHDDSTDEGEVVVDEGEIVDTVSPAELLEDVDPDDYRSHPYGWPS